MSNAARAILGFAFALTACGGDGGSGQNDAADVIHTENAIVDIERLPPDESSVTPSSQLVNGVAEPRPLQPGNGL